jgi:hypothetical protein
MNEMNLKMVAWLKLGHVAGIIMFTVLGKVTNKILSKIQN